jgi:transcriptional regulator with XRE-family HTH domain
MASTLQMKIQDYLDRNYLSMKAMERKAGVKVNTVRNILRGQSKRPSGETLHALAKILECTVYDLLRGPQESSEAGSSDRQETGLQKMIRLYMDMQGLSMRKLEQKAGLKLHAVTNILTGQSKMPTGKNLQALSNVMGCTVEDMLEGNTEALQETKTESRKISLIGIKYPDILAESFQHILKTISVHNYNLNLHQTLQILEEVYSYLIQKEPPQVDTVFIEWFVKRAAG